MTVAIPSQLTTYPQWVVWRWGAERSGRREKVPYYSRTGHRASVSNPDTWATFIEAVHALWGYDGLGFVLTEADPFVGVDLDHCRDPRTGTIKPWALKIIASLSSYTEITPSGAGIRIFLRGSLLPGGRKRGHVEIYDHSRFLTVTGWHLAGSPTTIEYRGEPLREVHTRCFPATRPAPTTGPRRATPPCGQPLGRRPRAPRAGRERVERHAVRKALEREPRRLRIAE